MVDIHAEGAPLATIHSFESDLEFFLSLLKSSDGLTSVNTDLSSTTESKYLNLIIRLTPKHTLIVLLVT